MFNAITEVMIIKLYFIFLVMTNIFYILGSN